MQLTKELFVIPNKSNFFLYAPLKGVIMEVNRDMITLLKQIQRGRSIEGLENELTLLLEKGILVESEEQLQEPTKKKNVEPKYFPTSVTLMPTFDCNLRCIYCYAEGGENIGGDMKQEVAKAALDLIVHNAQESGNKKIQLGFHGGGEPLLGKNMDFLKWCVGYFQEQAESRGLKPKISSATNGMISEKNLEWILTNFNHLNVSLDGPEDIQNRQRPMAGGRPSFQYVTATIARLEEKGFPYGIRATITDESVSRMSEIVEFFHVIAPSLKSFHLEPLSECGRCKTSNAKAPAPLDFLKYALQAKEVADKLDISIHYSGSKLGEVHHYFCGAAGKNFFVTPDGNVTTCLEACREGDEKSRLFMIGSYNPNQGSFVFDTNKTRKLMERRVENVPYCRDCFGKYSCAGDCLAKIFTQSGDLYDPSNNLRCMINRGLLLHDIKKRLKGGKFENEQKTEF